jgi:hypothetical protein
MQPQSSKRDPITRCTAHPVGSILRHVPSEAQTAAHYAYYL